MDRPYSPAHLETVERLSEPEVDAVTWTLEAATEADGVRPLSEHVELHLRDGGERPARHVLAWHGDTLAGYAHLDTTDAVAGPSAELVVHPAARRAGVGTALLRTLLGEAAPASLRVWAHGSLPGADALATSVGMARVRELLQMRRALPYGGAVPPLPVDVDVRAFDPDRDAEEWVRVNAEAFADHPEQGRLTLLDLGIRMREPWFDPAGFLVAERDGAMVGFAWTKVHGGAEQPRLTLVGAAPVDHPHPPLGELYVLGVAPSARVSGLGRALTVRALRHLGERGLRHAMLYADADNVPAVRLYTSLGFTRHSSDTMWQGAAAWQAPGS
ncbi:mycothiol synthase [Motilibacter peucedani]|uniref:Mycothiol acetyltransferase n=1 Tax=Motilibacter peucedani TaxID=598650 RepID=A0A420XT76_9ACTN|nr:mycothiol synthase [Motilibacter peucedani]RKS80014.1 mycothiol synthase [Motilibacter peucedani]